ncbi:GtrA family protein [Methylomicrobium lacus]|uniref:GtrA family protein n=1 Tax=Methylomicrobium lacus TaxID=136992 RepID=UPI00045E924B|nr:GtrA family protein [Methylomicrobium lacus]
MKTQLYKILRYRPESNLSQFICYFIVGGVAFSADFSMLFLLKEFAGFYYVVAASCGFGVGVLINYLLSVYWVFDYRAVDNRYVEFLLFGLIGVIGLILNAAIIYLLTEKMAVFYLYSKIIATAVIFLFNFTARKILLFTKRYVYQRAYS